MSGTIFSSRCLVGMKQSVSGQRGGQRRKTTGRCTVAMEITDGHGQKYVTVFASTCVPRYFFGGGPGSAIRTGCHIGAVFAALQDVGTAHIPNRGQPWKTRMPGGGTCLVSTLLPAFQPVLHSPRRPPHRRQQVRHKFHGRPFQKRLGHEREKSFDRALELEASRVAGEAEKQLADESYFSRPLNQFGYVTRDMYLPYIKNWHKYFKRSQLLIVRFEDFRASPQAAFDHVCDFIGAPRHRITQMIHNVNRGGEPMSASTRARLIGAFRDHNREMSEYLGRDFTWDQ
jgi:hypothetical protein